MTKKDISKESLQLNSLHIKFLLKEGMNLNPFALGLHLQGNLMISCLLRQDMLNHGLKLEIRAKMDF